MTTTLPSGGEKGTPDVKLTTVRGGEEPRESVGVSHFVHHHRVVSQAAVPLGGLTELEVVRAGTGPTHALRTEPGRQMAGHVRTVQGCECHISGGRYAEIPDSRRLEDPERVQIRCAEARSASATLSVHERRHIRRAHQVEYVAVCAGPIVAEQAGGGLLAEGVVEACETLFEEVESDCRAE